jgi:phosphoglycolate phosphatase
MKTDNVVFDLDGVLLDSETNLDWLDRAMERTLEKLGIPVTRENVEKLYPGGLQEFEKSVEEFSIDPEKIWTIRDGYYIAEKLEMIERGNLKPFPDVEALDELLVQYSLGIISNSPDEVVDRFVRTYGFEDTFKAWVGRGSGLDSLKIMKPDPHLFRQLKDEMGGGKFWYVGDREVDRKFAEVTGMEFLYLSRNSEGFESLTEIVDYLL